MVVVPCWWDGKLESLLSSITFQRPELIAPNYFDPIPLNPSTNFFEENEMNEIGELMLASFPPDTDHFIASISAENSWWLGEKYDGIRCCWNPIRLALFSRASTLIPIPENFLSQFPDTFMDGELWFGRREYNAVHSLMVARNFGFWDSTRIIAFDNPSPNLPFEKRYTNLLKLISAHHPFLMVATRLMCNEQRPIKKLVEHVITDGGEGVILRKIASMYLPGRSPYLYKLKTSRGDAEGIVVAKNDDKSVTLKLPNEVTFRVAASSIEIPQPEVGSIVSFFYERNARRDVPIGPRIYRVRSDLSWSDAVRNFKQEQLYLNESSHGASFKSKPVEYLDINHMRQFLESIAKGKNMDPLQLSTWRSIPRKFIRKQKGGTKIMKLLCKRKGGYFRSLKKIFPELILDNNPDSSINLWVNIENRRKFFEEYAEENRFDPLIAVNWYIQSPDNIKARKGASRVLAYYNSSISRALITLFPNIDFDYSKFESRHAWRDKDKRRAFFISFAEQNQFDPFSPACWYNFPRDKIMATKDINDILCYHNLSLGKALIELFPEIGLEKSALNRRDLWGDEKRRRDFFLKYAKDNNFDPLIAANWHLEPRDKIMSVKGAKRVIYYYDESLTKTLLALFPNIGLEDSKLRAKNPWFDKPTMKKALESYAKKNNFDPKVHDNWLKREKKIRSTPNLLGVLRWYPDLPHALVDLFPS